MRRHTYMWRIREEKRMGWGEKDREYKKKNEDLGWGERKL
jgi:hypothetical protein